MLASARPTVNQATQTERAMGLFSTRPEIADSGTQCQRFHGDQSYLVKQYGRHIFDFGQTVDEEMIRIAEEQARLEAKNRWRLFGQPSPRSHGKSKASPLQN